MNAETSVYDLNIFGKKFAVEKSGGSLVVKKLVKKKEAKHPFPYQVSRQSDGLHVSESYPDAHRRTKSMATKVAQKVFAPENVLVGANLGAYLYGSAHPETVNAAARTPLGAIFHKDTQHLIGNLIPMYILGKMANKEGAGKVYGTYAASAIAAEAVKLADPVNAFGLRIPVETLGSSNAVMGLLGLNMVNSIKDKTWGKLALLSSYATAVLQTGSQENVGRINQLGHQIGLATGAIMEGVVLPAVHRIKDIINRHSPEVITGERIAAKSAIS